MDNPLIPAVKYATLITMGDGVKTAWEFNFAGGYISPEHVKAFTENVVTGELVIRPLTLIGPNTAQIVPAVASGLRLIIYRDTPKTEPLVDYSTGSILNESSLDKSNKQAVFIAAELADRVIADYDFSNSLLYAVDAASAATAAASKAVNAVDALAGPSGSSKIGFSYPGARVVSRSIQKVLSERVSVKAFGAIGDGDSHPLSGFYATLAEAQVVYPHATSLSDEIDWCAIQACINFIAPQYDPTETYHDGNNFTRQGVSKTMYIETGTYFINRTLNFRFRNSFRVDGEYMYGTMIRWTGVANGMMFDAECSNYAHWEGFTLDGAHKALTFIYQAGNGNNAPNSKGNTTGNYFGHLYFWNQIGYLTGERPDFPDQYDPLTAMLCITSVKASSYYNSMDDSVIEHCRFAPNSLNNNFGIAMSSTTVPINQCWFGCANSVLVSNGASIVMNQCTSSNAAPAVLDDQHTHAVVKFAYTGVAYAYVTMNDCYHESMDYYGNGNSSILAYFAQGPATDPDNQSKVQQILIRGGLYACGRDNTPYIHIGANRRANIIIDGAEFQGIHKAHIYAPDSSISIKASSNATTAQTSNSYAWQSVAYRSLRNEYTAPDFTVRGEIAPDTIVSVGSVDSPTRLKFLSLGEALGFVSDSGGKVVVYMEKDDDLTQTLTVKSDVSISLQGHHVVVSGELRSRGRFSVTNLFGSSVRGGSFTSAANKFVNYGHAEISNVDASGLLRAAAGKAVFTNVDFQGSTVGAVLDGGDVVIDGDTCLYSGTGAVVDLGSRLSTATIKSSYGTVPTTGLWQHGMQLEFTLPAPGYPNRYWATSTGVGAAANWAHLGKLVS